MQLRSYQPTDAEALVAVFRDAVRGTGATAYNAQQVAAWSAFPEDFEQFRHHLTLGTTLVGMEDSQIVAFGQLEPSDYIAFLYTASTVGRRGYATAIYQQLEAKSIEQGNQRLRTVASRISKHFFLKMGFRVVEPEWVDRQGVPIERFKMEKRLASARPEIK
jgi:putative acetyltransferase